MSSQTRRTSPPLSTSITIMMMTGAGIWVLTRTGHLHTGIAILGGGMIPGVLAGGIPGLTGTVVIGTIRSTGVTMVLIIVTGVTTILTGPTTPVTTPAIPGRGGPSTAGRPTIGGRIMLLHPQRFQDPGEHQKRWVLMNPEAAGGSARMLRTGTG